MYCSINAFLNLWPNSQCNLLITNSSLPKEKIPSTGTWNETMVGGYFFIFKDLTHVFFIHLYVYCMNHHSIPYIAYSTSRKAMGTKKKRTFLYHQKTFK